MLTEKDYCDYDTCVALKELGFNQYSTLRTYAGEGGVWLGELPNPEPDYKEGDLIALRHAYGIPIDGIEIAAPSLYEAQKWLRDEKKIHIEIVYHSSIAWYEYLVKEADKLIASGTAFPSYEEALSTAIYMAINSLKEER